MVENRDKELAILLKFQLWKLLFVNKVKHSVPVFNEWLHVVSSQLLIKFWDHQNIENLIIVESTVVIFLEVMFQQLRQFFDLHEILGKLYHFFPSMTIHMWPHNIMDDIHDDEVSLINYLVLSLPSGVFNFSIIVIVVLLCRCLKLFIQKFVEKDILLPLLQSDISAWNYESVSQLFLINKSVR